MKKKEWNEGLNNLAPDILENYIEQKEKFAKMNNSRDKLIHIVATVACLLFVVSSIVVGILIDDKIPTWENAQYSAEDIARMFSTRNYDSTNAYTELDVPDSKYLYINEIPKDEYLGIYQYNYLGKELNKNEFKAFIDGILPELSSSIGVSIPTYEIKENVSGDLWDGLYTKYDEIGDYHLNMDQELTYNLFSVFSRRIDDKGYRSLVIDGETIEINTQLSDEEILEELESVNNRLFEIFGTSFSNFKINHSYGSGSLYLYFYNEDEHNLNYLCDIPRSERICMEFCGSKLNNDNNILSLYSVRYYKPRLDINQIYPIVANAKKISLQDAEKLLYKGYVFGGHACPLCMAEQEKISFKGYDFVDMEYIFEYDIKTSMPRLAIPFYAFYKKIGTAKNGNKIYAKTYVAAIELKGYEEYFESQKSKHSQTDN